MECEFCKKTFSTKGILNRHKTTAKYCLQIKNNTPLEGHFKCLHCNKTFSRKFYRNNHQKDCDRKSHEITRLKQVIQKKDEEIKQVIQKKDEEIKIILQENYEIKQILQKKYEEIKRILNDKDEERIRLEEKAKLLEISNDRLMKTSEKLNMAAINKPSVVNNTNKTVQINNYIQNNLEPLTEEDIKNAVKHFTLEHYLQGVNGCVKYALEYPFKNRIVCSDPSRNKVKYKNSDGTISEDAGFKKHIVVLCQSLEDKSIELNEQWSTNLFATTDYNEGDFKVLILHSQTKNAIIEGAKGNENSFTNKLTKRICHATTIDSLNTK
jgi:hypothetical protein